MTYLPATPATPARLLLVIDEMEVGGTQRQIVNIACGLDRARFTPTLLYFSRRSHLVDELERAGVAVHCIARLGRLDAGFVWKLRSFLQRGRFDVMHCFSYSGEVWTALARRSLPRRLRPPIITSIRGVYEWYSPWHWRAKRWVTRESAAVVANSRRGADYAAARLEREPPGLCVIYNGVAEPATDGGAVARLRAALAPDSALVVFVGRLVDHKDLPTLLRAAQRLHAAGRCPTIVLAGDGPLRAELERLAAELGVGGRITFLGEYADAATLIAAGDLLVLPSVREGLSNVILEAMVAGKPVIASSAGGNTELIEDDVSGVLFEVGDDAAFARAIDRVARHPDLRTRLGHAARHYATTQFSVTAMIDAISGCYESVVSPPCR